MVRGLYNANCGSYFENGASGPFFAMVCGNHCFRNVSSFARSEPVTFILVGHDKR